MSSIPRTVYIYALVDPDTQEIRYIGKTVDPDQRFRSHLSHCQIGSTYCQRWLRCLCNQGKVPEFRIIEITGDDWPEREQYWIRYYNSIGVPLTNTAEGGKGALGVRHTEEAKAKMSQLARLTGRRPPPHTEEIKERLRRERIGRQHTEEAKAKISARFKGQPLSDDHRKKLRQRKIELFKSERGQELADQYSRQYARLTDEQVLEIWHLVYEGRLSQQKIADLYGIPNSLVSQIKTGKRYKHVKRPKRDNSSS